MTLPYKSIHTHRTFLCIFLDFMIEPILCRANLCRYSLGFALIDGGIFLFSSFVSLDGECPWASTIKLSLCIFGAVGRKISVPVSGFKSSCLALHQFLNLTTFSVPAGFVQHDAASAMFHHGGLYIQKNILCDIPAYILLLKAKRFSLDFTRSEASSFPYMPGRLKDL